MKNITTQPARKENFFKRDKLINKIYRKLDAGDHIFMAAPRRVGKTSIMRYLEDHPRESYHFIYLTVESVHEVETFYHKLWDALAESDFYSFFSKASKKTKNFLNTTLDRISGIGIPVLGSVIELNPSEKSSYQEEFDDVIKSLKNDKRKLVFMIDEFPQVVENINARHGKEIATQFLHLCREQRQLSQSNVLFIYTGVTGLLSVVRRITSPSVINDIVTIEVPPLSKAEATEMATMILNNYNVGYEVKVIDYLLEKMEWLIPFHVQLCIQELIDIYESEERNITKADVNKAFDRLLNIRNNQYFEPYHTRLKEAFPDTKIFDQSIELLNYIVMNEEIGKQEAMELIGKELENDDYERVMESLQFDGYLKYDEECEVYKFTSRLIKMWWKKFVVK